MTGECNPSELSKEFFTVTHALCVVMGWLRCTEQEETRRFAHLDACLRGEDRQGH